MKDCLNVCITDFINTNKITNQMQKSVLTVITLSLVVFGMIGQQAVLGAVGQTPTVYLYPVSSSKDYETFDNMGDCHQYVMDNPTLGFTKDDCHKTSAELAPQ
jgi:hypothetical protein